MKTEYTDRGKAIKILYLGFHHYPNDPRLRFRQVQVLSEVSDNISFYYIGSPRFTKNSHSNQKDELLNVLCYNERTRSVTGDNCWLRRNKKKLRNEYAALIRALQLRPDIVQVSDVRELLFGICLRLITGAKIVYDSHEDYFNQIFEYSGRTFKAYIAALAYRLIEVVCSRLFDTIFCTDEYLLGLYKKRIFGFKCVFLLRNFANTALIPRHKMHSAKRKLRLVYIGGVNKYRGVIECANYVDRFNRQNKQGLLLSLTVYTRRNRLLDELLAEGRIEHCDYLDYPSILQELLFYDVGICLWQKIKKFERNLPIKNFDYMAVGLPIITSNFGRLKDYAMQAKAGYCIDPSNYGEFESAILKLFDHEKRNELGRNGIKYTHQHASFRREARDYISVMTGLSKRLPSKTS